MVYRINSAVRLSVSATHVVTLRYQSGREPSQRFGADVKVGEYYLRL